MNGELKKFLTFTIYHSSSERMSVRIKILTSIYIFILAGIIFLADFYGTNFFNFVGIVPLGDKLGHFFLMGAFSFLLNLALSAKTVKFVLFNYLSGSLIVFGLVTIEEISQIFIIGRTFDAGDLIFDYAGIFIFGEAARFVFCKYVKF